MAFWRKLPKDKIIWCIGIPYTKEQFNLCCSAGKDSDFIESLEFKYGTNDVDLLWERYQPTANKIRNCVNYLSSKGVTISCVSSIENLKSIFNHAVIIITAHRHRYLDCLDFMGNAITTDSIADIIPPEYNGIIDISSCYSATFQMRWKQKRINVRYIAANTESSIDLRLYIYEHVIRYMLSHPGRDYLQSLTIIAKRIESWEKESKNKRDDVFLGGKPLPDQQMEISASAFAPSEILKGDDMMIQVYIYEDKKHNEIVIHAINADEGTTERSRISIYYNLKPDDIVSIQLNIFHIPQVAQKKEIIWNGAIAKAYFLVKIPDDFEKKKCFAELVLTVNNAPIGELSFSTKVVESYTSDKTTTDVFFKQYKKVFISYSHQDVEKVRYIDHAYEAVGIDHFFDRRYLRPGTIFPLEIQEYIKSADLFILCWSDNASRSEYVQKELEQALQRAYPNLQPPDENQLAIYPLGIPPHAELPENMKDIFSFALV